MYTMPAGEDLSSRPSGDTPRDMPALVSIADSLDCPFTALPSAAFLNALHWLLFLPFSQVINRKHHTSTCSEFRDWLFHYKSHPAVSCCHFQLNYLDFLKFIFSHSNRLSSTACLTTSSTFTPWSWNSYFCNHYRTGLSHSRSRERNLGWPRKHWDKQKR